MNKIEDLLEKQSKSLSNINAELCDIKVTVAKQEINLKADRRRTSLLEDSVGMLRREFNPIKTHVAVTNGIVKAFIVIIAAGGTIAGILKVFIL